MNVPLEGFKRRLEDRRRTEPQDGTEGTEEDGGRKGGRREGAEEHTSLGIRVPAKTYHRNGHKLRANL